MAGDSIERRRERRSEGDESPRESEDVGETQIDETVESQRPVEDRLREAMEDLAEQEDRVERTSQRLEEAFEELRNEEKQKESTETRLRESLDSLEDDESFKNNQIETGEPSQQEKEAEEAEQSGNQESSEKSSEGKHETSIEYIQQNLEESEIHHDSGEAQGSDGAESKEKGQKHVDESHAEAQDNRETIQQLKDVNESAVDEVVSVIEELAAATPQENSRIHRIDVRSELSEEEVDALEHYVSVNSKEIEEQLSQNAQPELNEHESIHVGMVDGKLYIRRLDEDPIRLENAYADLYYYFRDRESFEKYMNDAGESMGLEGASQREIREHMRELAEQLIVEPLNDSCINSRTMRIRGDFVDLMNDVSGKTLQDIESSISKLTGFNGQGGIENPRFPHGDKLETAVARMAATIMSDCTIEPNGVIKYGEADRHRIERVIETAQQFGDIAPKPTYIDDGGHYITHLPFVIGKLMIHREIPSGDRTIQNPRLIPSVRNGSEEVKRAYVEDFVTQDGCIGQKSVIWRRANVLDAGGKAEKYNFESKIGVKEKDFIKEYGRKERGNAESSSLSWGKLGELEIQSSDSISTTATKIKEIIYNNPNKLIIDEVDVVQEMGINVDVKPSEIKHYPKSDRVSVVWQAHTTGLKESIKLGIVIRPNDVVKEQKVREMILKNPTLAKESIHEFESKEVDFDRWWE